MHVFISWSKPRSKAIALALRDWLPHLFESIEPWVSSADIDAGRRWDGEISQSLSQSDVGILCVTPDNLKEPWLLFEAGALAKKVTEARVVPYLSGLEPSHLTGSPLGQLQAQRTDEVGTRAMVNSIAKAYTPRRPDDLLGAAFDKWWPDLDAKLREIDAQRSEPPPQLPTDSEMLKNLFGMVQMVASLLAETRGEVGRLARTRSSSGSGSISRSSSGSLPGGQHAAVLTVNGQPPGYAPSPEDFPGAGEWDFLNSGDAQRRGSP